MLKISRKEFILIVRSIYTYTNLESMSTWCQVVKKFKEECKCIQDSRFSVPVDLTKIKFLASIFCNQNMCIIEPYSFKSVCPRSWTLPSLQPRGASVGVLPLGFEINVVSWGQLLSLPAKVYHSVLFCGAGGARTRRQCGREVGRARAKGKGQTLYI